MIFDDFCRQSPRKRSGVREHGVALTTVNQSKQKQLRRKNIKEKQGYCECCQAKYEDLHQVGSGQSSCLITSISALYLLTETAKSYIDSKHI